MFFGKIILSHSRSLYLEILKAGFGEFSHFCCDVDNDDNDAAADNVNDNDNDDDDDND